MRLKVMEFAQFKCQMCGAKDKTLHIHHINYEKGKKPWEYHYSNFKCLCEDCHEGVETTIFLARRVVSWVPHEIMAQILLEFLEAYNKAVEEGEEQSAEMILTRALAGIRADYILNNIIEKLGENRNAIVDFLAGDLIDRKKPEGEVQP